MFRDSFERVLRYLSDTASSGKVRHEGQITTVGLTGAEPIDKITAYINKGCREAVDNSVESSAGGPEQKLPAANNLLIAIYLVHGRAVRYQQVTDARDLCRNLARSVTEYAHKQCYLLVGNRVEIPAISIRDTDEPGKERIEIRWQRSEPVSQVRQQSSVKQPVNQPSTPDVKGSDKITAESSEDEARLSEPFALWVKDGRDDPVLWDELLTPFYFGKSTKHSQVNFAFADKDQISRDHFAVLYLPRERFLLRNNGRNGTIVIRGNQAVRLFTPPTIREARASAKIARLSEGDIIRLQAGPLEETRIVQMAFCKPGTPVEDIRWVDSLAGINCAEAIDPVARRIRDGVPPDQYTLICGEQFLGSAITQGVKFSYDEEDQGFVGGKALAVVSNFGNLTIRWLRDDVPATAAGAPLPIGLDIPLRSGDELRFQTDEGETRVVFDWTENGQ